MKIIFIDQVQNILIPRFFYFILKLENGKETNLIVPLKFCREIVWLNSTLMWY